MMLNDILNGSSWSMTGNCHGCSGRGWVETSDRTPHKCPVCTGSGKYMQPGLNPYPFVPAPHPYEPWKPVGPSFPQYPSPWTIISTSDKTIGNPILSGPNNGIVTVPNGSITITNLEGMKNV